MSAQLFTGHYDGARVVVTAASAECLQNCERVSLRRVPDGTVFPRGEYAYRKTACHEHGLTCWYEQRDPERLAAVRGRREREHRDADERRRREAAWRQADARRRRRRAEPNAQGGDEAALAEQAPRRGWSEPEALAGLAACHASARAICSCSSCVGVDRVESLVALERLGRVHDGDLPREVTTKIASLLDQFVSDAVEELNSKSSLPQQDVEHVCARLRAKVLKKAEDALHSAAPAAVELWPSARLRLEQDLDKLRQFVVRWNESKGVRFRSSGNAALKHGIPGDAVVVGADDADVRRYLNSELAEQHALFGRHKCVFMKKLGEAAKQSIFELFEYKGLRYEAIAERATQKLAASSGGVCKFEIEHRTTVRERGPRRSYPLNVPETELGFSLQHINAQRGKDTTSWNWALGTSGVGFDAGVGGTVGSTLTSTRQVARTMTGTARGYCVIVDMVVRNETCAHLSAHAVSAIMTAGRAKDANHEVTFASEIPLQLTLHVPVPSVVSAWVTNPVSDLLNQLLGDPMVSILCGRSAVRIAQATYSNAMVLTDQTSTGASSAYNITGDCGAAFLIHPEGDAFFLSVVQEKPKADDVAGYQSTPPLWVGLGDGGRLVLSKTRELFSLHRDSFRYKHWVLRAHSLDAFVVRHRSDGGLCAAAAEPESGSELIFSRAIGPTKRTHASVASGA